jgi:hypothetical protein
MQLKEGKMPEMMEGYYVEEAYIELRGGKRTQKGGGRGKHRGEKIVGYATVNAELFPELSKYFWYRNNRGYPVTNIRDSQSAERTILQLHHLVWILKGNHLPTKPLEVDHKNQIKLDNRVSNLRIATKSIQKANSTKHVDNSSGFKGVSHATSNNGRNHYWCAQVVKDGKRVLDKHFRYDPSDRAAEEQAWRLAAKAVYEAYLTHYPEVDPPDSDWETKPYFFHA